VTQLIIEQRPIWKRFWLWVSVILLLLVVALVGPWPVDGRPYIDTGYAKRTFAQLSILEPAIEGRGTLQAGLAVIDITPPMGVALAGYSARNPKANQGVRDRVYVKALSLKADGAVVTILSADYLLPIEQLISAVLARTGVERAGIYFAATHTHSGPGGFGENLLSEYALGDFDPEQFERMVSSFSRAVLESRASMQAVRLSYRQQQLDEAVSATLLRHAIDKSIPIRATLNLLQIYPLEGRTPLLSMVSFPAHPTLLGKRNYRVSGDYPAVVQRELQQMLGGEVLFTVGAVGGMKANSRESGREARVVDVGKRVAAHYGQLAAGEGHRFNLVATELPIASYLLPIELSSPNLQLSDGWRLSPLIMKLIHNEQSYLHLLRIGDLYLAGYPADFSIDLADYLREQLLSRGVALWPTSFNGDYIGYLMPQAQYSISHYETRRASLYGPWGGEYFVDLTLRLVEQQVAPHIEAEKSVE